MPAVRCYIGLGSNRCQPRQQIERALERLRHHPQWQIVAQSPLYRSAPMGPQDQDDYINAVVAIDTPLAPGDLLDALQAIEREQGRERSRERRWGPRTLDLDILLYGDRVIDSERLTVPHPGLTERAFVLYPLVDIEADIALPDGRRIGDLLSRCSGRGLQRLSAGDAVEK
ncbi:MAG: 2-amino-4-hydroxy-6-hydroxymethyldihydropteridine diphosphokinase [Pseudomonadota bacterium]